MRTTSILLIEDDPVARFLTRERLNEISPAITLECAANGQEGLGFLNDIIKKNPDSGFPEIILLDINMPVMSGWDFLNYFKECFEDVIDNTSVYICNSGLRYEEREYQHKYPFVKGYISKPLSKADLQLVLEEVWSRPQN